ncbi:MAG: UDP-N-acetylmuramoyl-L-alanine--D-glutamate ligase, partial [Cytophagales bacterium]|nr:UDP-N-acetylmuramoyl-L-alanine--D-glutamate ligase [Cytophaga sp.]
MSKKVIILGSGESGVGAALLAKAKAYDTFVSDSGTITPAYITELEQASVPFEQGMHSESIVLSADLIIKSPGIPEKAPVMKLIRAKGIEVISEIEFAYRHAPDAKYVAITGSNGKTTTTLLTHHIFQKLGYSVGLGGNIGTSLARQVIGDKKDVYVLELSSFQLDDMYQFKADVAVLLNITPDHLDRYEYNFENYIASKFRVVQNMNQSDTFIAYDEDPVITGYKKTHPIEAEYVPVSLKRLETNGAYSDEKMIQISSKDGSLHTYDVAAFSLQGKHNCINIMAAMMAAVSLGADPDTCAEAIKDFKNAPHRLEFVASIYGIKYVN